MIRDVASNVSNAQTAAVPGRLGERAKSTQSQPCPQLGERQGRAKWRSFPRHRLEGELQERSHEREGRAIKRTSLLDASLEL
jgi:hypothetical protein